MESVDARKRDVRYPRWDAALGAAVRALYTLCPIEAIPGGGFPILAICLAEEITRMDKPNLTRARVLTSLTTLCLDCPFDGWLWPGYDDLPDLLPYPFALSVCTLTRGKSSIEGRGMTEIMERERDAGGGRETKKESRQDSKGKKLWCLEVPFTVSATPPPPKICFSGILHEY